MLWEGENTGDVIPLRALLFLAEVSNEMAATLVARGHAVEEKRIDIVVEGLMVEEELGKETEIAAPGTLPPAVYLEEGDGVVPVDLVARRVHEGAF